ncbi:RHS repeat-associated core domain-containing protein [Streptomyces sp. NPDC001941]|uniref:RHS repeat-associated core domain-containing protein n=1 Tax=Streptomyces sp. NPDC001941 TaxID=3154659 RepID=UPI0033279D44
MSGRSGARRIFRRRGRFRSYASFVAALSALLLVVTTADPATAAVLLGNDGRSYAVTPEGARPVPVKPVPKRPVARVETPVWKATAARRAWPRAGAAEASARAGSTRAGALPVWVGAPVTRAASRTAAAPVDEVRVELGDRAAADRAGVAGVLGSLRRTAPGNAGRVHLELDYRTFAQAYGGDWASRLRLVQLPACALTTPARPACRTQTPLASTNDAKIGRVAADVPVAAASGSAAQPVVFAAAAGASGGGGSYGATSLAPSGQWSAGGSTGGFSWSYPIGLPDVPGGFKPNVGLEYGSQGVDGRTSSTNGQASWIGDGWDYSPGFVERSYPSCSDDVPAGGANRTSDQCWSDDATTLTLSLNGASNTLVFDDASKTWHPQNDNGEKIAVRKDTVNGDNDNEYWVVTTADGSEYHFGQHRLPGWAEGGAVTNSAWTVPVYGNDDGEPCHAATFAASSCQQAYRWNLDYAVDSHGNAISYWYTPEYGYYGPNNGIAPTRYTRAGHLAKIQYGQRDGKVYDAASPAAGQVLFDTTERCLPDKTFDCAETKRTAANSARWPDVPLDQNCAATGSCANHGASFWSTRRLTGIRTQVLVDKAYDEVDEWKLNHTFPATGDTTTPTLWLSSIERVGKAGGGTLSLPLVTFDGQPMANRVDGLDGYQPITRRRMTTITTESGKVITVNYLAAQCHRKGTVVLPSSPQTNTMRCYPSFWTPPGKVEPELDWFNKYVVNTVTEQDPTGNGQPVQTSYRYLGDTYWAFNDDPMSKAKYRTYNQWRGFGRVETRTGTAPEKITLARTTYFRGKGGELTNTVGDVTVTDAEPLTGQVFESESFDGDGGTRLASATTEPWIGPVTATHARTEVGLGNLQARILNTKRTRNTTTKADGEPRTTETVTEFDAATGLPRTVDDKGDVSTTTDDKCSRTWYAKDATGKELPVPRRMQTVAVACSATPTYPRDAISDDLAFFDGHTDNLAAPGIGDVTMVQKADSVAEDGTPHYVTVLKNTFDSYGRETSETDALGRTTTTIFTPASGTTPPTVKVTQPKVTGQTAGFTTTTTADPERGLPVRTTDAAGYATTSAYDALGRLTSVWRPGFSTSNGPNTRYTYSLSPTAPSTVKTESLNDDGTYRTSITLYDSLLRQRETQVEAADGGSVISDTVYDSHGWTVKAAGPYYSKDKPSATLVYAPDNQVPTQTGTFYDGAGRVTDSVAYTRATETWRTRTSYPGSDRTDVVPPLGATPTSAFSDARGNTTQLLRYQGRTASGPADSVTYSYDSSGRQTGQDDGKGHTWSSTFDLLGRKTSQTDPDTGTSTSSYDAAGQLTGAKDARKRSTGYVYDELGRRTAAYDTTGVSANGKVTDGKQLAGWTYDTLKKGLPTSSTSYQDGAAYTSKVMGYDSHGWPTASAVVIPASEGNLQGTYLTQNQYNPTGTLHSYTSTAAGYLPQETYTYDYDRFGRVKSVGSPTVNAGLSWTQFDEPEQYTLGTSGNFAQQTLKYDEQTHRLKSSFVVTAAGAKVSDRTTYDYQPAGNVTKIRDELGDGQVDVQCFAHDWAQRLETAWTSTDDCARKPEAGAATGVGGPAAYWQSWTYDATGNRASQTDHDPAGDAAEDTVSTYAPPAAGQGPAHALGKVAKDAPGGDTQDTETTYTYDDSGNILTRTGRSGTDTFAYDTSGKLKELSRTATGTSTKYVYDASGSLLIRRDAGSTVLFTGDQELTLKDGADKAEGTRYVGLGGQTVAVQSANAQGVKVDYLVSDRQNTGTLQIDAATQQVTRRQYKPFGEVRTADAGWQGARGFVGGQEDKSTGLVNLGARQYDPVVGRFLNPDPLIVPGEPETWNAYAYAGNNPTTSSDPSGLCPADLCGVGTPMGDGSGRIITDGPVDPGGSNPTTCHRGMCSDGNPVGGGKDGRGNIGNTTTNAKAQQAAAERAAKTASAVAAAAKKERQGLADKLINLVADLVGITDAVNCFTKGDVMGCFNTALNAVPWGKLAKAIKAGYKAFKIWRAFRKAEAAIKDAENALEAAQTTLKAARAQAEALESAAAACVRHSFTGDTKVLLSDGTTKPIAELRPGDKVVSSDPQTEVTSGEPVERRIVTEDDKEFTDLTVEQPSEPGAEKTASKLTTTWHHPFWDETSGKWIPAKDLHPGTKLRRPDGTTVTVVEARNYRGARVTYDLTVRELHSYYVVAGDAPVLVHNCPVFRGMKIAADGMPAVGRSAKHLGVRIGTDVHPSARNTVSPGKGGMSGATTPGGLPVHRRPTYVENGEGKGLELWEIDEADLPDGLTAVQDGTDHVTTGPSHEMPLSEFEGLLESTRSLWKHRPA